MEIMITQIIALCGLIAIAILLITTGYKEFRLRKKVELLTHIIDKGYEHDNVDINSL